MTLLATTPVNELELLNTETGERREVVARRSLWPDRNGDYRLEGPRSGSPVWFNEDGSSCGTKSPWRIERRAVDADAELVKLAKEAYCSKDVLGSDVYAELAVRAHHATIKAKAVLSDILAGKVHSIERLDATIAALDALRLTPPVDPLEAAANELAAQYEYPSRHALLVALKRGLELAERGEG